MCASLIMDLESRLSMTRRGVTTNLDSLALAKEEDIREGGGRRAGNVGFCIVLAATTISMV